MSNSNKNPFDFTDLSDLPEDLANKLHTDTNENAVAYAEVVRKGAEAGLSELDINQIIAAATRLGLDVPKQQTVRNYLNKAVELGLINKPTRQTYGADIKSPGTKAESAGLEDPKITADVPDEAPAEAASDPLAAM